MLTRLTKSLLTGASRIPWTNLLIGLASLIITLCILEFATRLIMAEPLLQFKDFRGRIRNLYQEGLPAQFDASLGWIPQVGFSGSDNKWETQVTILDNGIRSNGHNHRSFQHPPILAVGDSFTFGDEVADHETWPAILETLLGKPVINGGVFAYGTDQVFLRLKALIPVYMPDIVIYSFMSNDLERSEYALALGANRPYFHVENDELQLMNTPVRQIMSTSAIKEVLGHSLLANQIMMRIDPNWWLSGRSWNQAHTGNAGETITCLIFEEMNELAKTEEIQFYVLVQAGKEPDESNMEAKMNFALTCIDETVITVIDVRDDLIALRRSEPEQYEALFQSHMTPTGNLFIAKKVAEVIAEAQLD